MTAPSDAGGGEAQPSDGSDRCPSCRSPVDDAWLACASCGQPLAAEAELPSGSLLAQGRFEVLRVLGRGGFGITYEVADQRLLRRVAVKELFPDSAVRHGSMVLTPPHARPAFREARDRFLREARVLARFTHPGVVRVYEVFEEHNTAYLVMELLEGRNLLDLLHERGRPFGEDDVLDVAARAAGALRSVHAAGVLHRDINPSNIVLTDDGRIVVIDFGLARSYVVDQTTPMTQVVTPGYAPLEQYVGEGRFGPPSDVYGLAATLYRLATARVPVPALEREAGADLPSPHKLNPAISKMVSDGILDGLEPNFDHRPQTLDAFLRRLGIAHQPRSSRSPLLDTIPPVNRPPAAPVAPVPRGAAAGRAPLDPTAPGDDRSTSGSGQGRTELVTDRSAADRTRRADHDPVPAGGAPGAHGQDGTAAEGPTSLAAPMTATLPEPPRGPRSPSLPPPSPGSGSRALGPAAAAGMVAPMVGPSPAGRWKVTVPAAAAALAIGSAAPVATIAVLVLLGLPLLATWGDSVVHHARQQAGTAHGWLERAAPAGAAAPVRLVGNVVVSVVRAVPTVALAGGLLGLWYGLRHLHVAVTITDLVLRLIGLLVTALLVLPARRGSPRFRTGVAIDDATGRLLEPGGRLGQRAVVLWLVAAFFTAGGLWLSPDVWPLPR